MDPKAVAARNAFITAMDKLNDEYITLMIRLGVKRIPLFRF